MELLFDTSLVASTINLNNTPCHTIVQFTVMVAPNRFIKAIILKDGSKEFFARDNYYVLQVNESNQVVPVHSKYIESICTAIRSIPFKKCTLDTKIKNVYENFRGLKSILAIKLSSNMSAIVGNSNNLVAYCNLAIGVDTVDAKSARLAKFMFYAFDGVDIHIDLAINLSDFSAIRHWHTLSGFDLLVDGSKKGNFSPISICISDEQVCMTCELVMFYTLNKQRVENVFLSNLNIYETTDFMLSTAGYKNKVSLPDNYKTTTAWYTVVIPIEGLLIDNEVGIGATHYYPKSDPEIQRIIEQDDTIENYDAFALVHINANSMFEAYEKSKRQIEQSLDFLVNIVKDDCVYSNHAVGKHAINRHFDDYGGRVALLPAAFIEAPLLEKRISIRFGADLRRRLKVPESIDSMLSDIQNIEMLMIKAEGQIDKEISPLLNSLKWVRKAWDSDNKEDQVIFAVTALEFIVSKEKGGTPLIPKTLRKSSLACLEEHVREHTELNGDELESYIRRVSERYNHMCTEIPFMQKLRNLINRLSIPVTEKELELIHTLRTCRNEIIHGKNLENISIDQVQLVCQIISTIAFYKLNSLDLK